MGSFERGGLNRREFLKGTVAVGAMALLAACGKSPEKLETSEQVVGYIKKFGEKLATVRDKLMNLKVKVDTKVIQKDSAVSLHKTIGELIDEIGKIERIVAKDGDVSIMGAVAFKGTKERQNTLGRDPRFSTKQQETLSAAWQERIDGVTKANDLVDEIRAKIVEHKQLLQGEEKYANELVAIEKFGGRAPDLMQQVENTAEQVSGMLKSISVDLENLIKRF